MNNKILYFLIMASIFFQGCNGEKPTINEIAGIWKSNEGAIIDLNKNGSFACKNLPLEVFIFPGESKYSGQKFSAVGKWKIISSSPASDQLPWVIQISISNLESSDYHHRIGSLIILISGSGLMENKPPWDYLFVWEGEEGGRRYKLYKKRTNS